MTRFYKKMFLLTMAITISASLMACGGKKEASTNGSVKREFVYVPSFQDLPDKDDINNVAIGNKTIFYNSYKFDDNTQVYTSYIKSFEVGSNESKELPIQFGENESISNIDADKDDNLVVLTNVYTQGENPEDYTNSFLLKKYDKEGTELLSKDLTELTAGVDNVYIQYISVDGEGNIYLSNGDSKIWVLDATGNSLFTIDSDSYISGMGTTKEGKVVISTYGTDKAVFQDIDIAKKGFGSTYENIPQNFGGVRLAKGIDKGCLINSGNSLYEYDFDSQTTKEILNWIDSDIDSDSVMGVLGLDDGRILALSREYTDDGQTTSLIYLTKMKASEVAEKTIITYGSLYLNSRLRSEIIKFNKTNEKYRIQPKEYSTDDYEAGLAQLNSDIISGKAPDIIDLSSSGVKQYMEKGVLEDLYPYFEKDSEVKKENYVQSVLKAYEKDGKLFAITPSFSISTIVGKTSDVGSDMGWKMQDLMNYVKSKPEAEAFSDSTKETMLSMFTYYGINNFIDWTTGKCSFDGEEFTQLLEFCNTFKNQSEYVYDENSPSMPQQIRSGKVLLNMLFLNNVDSYQTEEMMFGEPITCIGYPSNTGNGSYISADEMLIGISSKSKNKDAAWEFVRTFLLSDYQNGDRMWSFPILQSALEAKFKEAMEPSYYDDENGNKVKAAKSSISYGEDDSSMVEVFEATQEQVDAVRNLINSADSAVEYNIEISNIINEEATAYFAGQKTAKDVADIIQSRVQIYVNENR